MLFTPPAPSGLQLLQTAQAAAVAAVDFTGLTGFDRFLLVFDSVLPSVGAQLMLRVSLDNGATWEAGADYLYGRADPAGAGWASSGANTNVPLNNGSISDSAVAGGAHGRLWIHGAADAAAHTRVDFDMASSSSKWYGAARLALVGSVNGVRLFFSGANIAAGDFALYGLRA